MATITNQKTGETIESNLSNAEAATLFAKHFGENTSHFMWYWLHKLALEAANLSANPVAGSSKLAAGFISNLFVVALGYGLKRPMIRVHYRGMRFKLYLSQRGTVCLKGGRLVATKWEESPEPTMPNPIYGMNVVRSTPIAWSNEPEGDEEYIGCYQPSGEFSPARLGTYGDSYRNRPLRKMHATETEFLAKLAEAPVAFLAACSKDMDRCCYCYKALEDERSKAVGYGKTCAERWGLPWGKLHYDEKTPSFAGCYDDNAAGIIAAIRSNPKDEGAWMVFGDWLEEHGLRRCTMPSGNVALPRS